MREIKFRGWTGLEMIYSEHYDYVNLDPNFDKLCFMDAGHDYNDKTYIKQVMQFTGLQDSKGTDIYEGDIIVSSYFEDGHKIEFHEGMFGGWEYAEGKEFTVIAGWLDRGLYIIGNIYQNLELLGKIK